MNSSAVAFHQVSHRFIDTQVLEEISFVLPAGQMMGLLGHNGAGKSTLIKIILGLITPMQGEVDVLGQRLSAQDKPMDIGYLPENISFYDKLTGYEVLSYFAALKKVKPVVVTQLLSEFGLDYAQHKPVKTYSKGMKQRLGFAQAILAKPRLLLLDEPTVGLDPQASQFIYSKLQQLKSEGCAVLVCTHELNLIEHQLDLALMLGRGRNIAFGSLPELMASSELLMCIEHGKLSTLINQHPYLQSFYQDNALYCSVSEQETLIKYLTLQCQLFDFKLSMPGLSDIYHSRISQLQLISEQGLGFAN